ncbi:MULTISPECIES: hypothetical protein [Prochlorococcus]|uniref:hypothetical protein n=1 Tax=Prochlorococcus TaxID=1218 RepID=UPI00145CFBB7|nr:MULTISPECIES: hypothetical protein [Prochlorococcus]NMO83123.1 hypothetical protein [Prochlorococcus sp. P1344]NMP06124.1 hypothetical protein [Prochlorococcus sp. P1361]NMP12336.1 hypothetical protein [Prochlorococcus sp.P1363]
MSFFLRIIETIDHEQDNSNHALLNPPRRFQRADGPVKAHCPRETNMLLPLRMALPLSPSTRPGCR